MTSGSIVRKYSQLPSGSFSPPVTYALRPGETSCTRRSDSASDGSQARIWSRMPSSDGESAGGGGNACCQRRA